MEILAYIRFINSKDHLTQVSHVTLITTQIAYEISICKGFIRSDRVGRKCDERTLAYRNHNKNRRSDKNLILD